MIAKRDDAMLYYIREQGLGMAEALPIVTNKKCDTIKTLALFRNELQGASALHSYCQYPEGCISYFSRKINAL